jgi:DNA invertase Pin-like site-specific DNA recombinase
MDHQSSCLKANWYQNQEEACKNYILSQAFNGWEYFKTYTDSGISGGTMNRAALQEMLEDMKKGLIQIVVTYKVDRLSRSIIDFHNMMKEFEKYNCDFVSITQSFDTSTSMGKLTLNMLLSFAQFEREVSSERIRDKLAASKRKGMWTGGPPPLGYDVVNKKLVVNEKEAEDVRLIFEKYLQLQSIIKLREYLNLCDIRGKRWTMVNGEKRGGSRFTSSMLGRVLDEELGGRELSPSPGLRLFTGSKACRNKRIISTEENNTNLLRALSISWRYAKLLKSGVSINAMKKLENVGDRTIYRYLSLNYLSPRIVNDIMKSKIPQHVNLMTLFRIAEGCVDFGELGSIRTL